MRKLSFLALTIAVVLLAGCAMTSSIPISQKSALGCSSEAGVYYLSKTFLDLEVVRWVKLEVANATATTPIDGAQPQETRFEVKPVVERRKADREHGFCLDYLASATADEQIYVKTDANHLLSSISTKSIDQTGYILRTLINALFIGIAGEEGDKSRSDKQFYKWFQAGTEFKGEYDPLDPEQSALVNERLSTLRPKVPPTTKGQAVLGLCLVLEGETFDPKLETINGYCNNPRRWAVKSWRASAQVKPTRDDPHADRAADDNIKSQSRGVHYRPRVPYTLYVFERRTGRHASGWKLRTSTVVKLESPDQIITVGVDRTLFAHRRTALMFDSGALTNVCIFKSSEIAEAATIPLTIAQNLVALPANILQLKIENNNNSAEVAKAEDKLIQAQRDHLKVLAGQASSGAASAKPPSAFTPEYTQPTYDAAGYTNAKATDASTGFDKSSFGKICPGSEIPDGLAAAANATPGGVVVPGFVTTTAAATP